MKSLRAEKEKETVAKSSIDANNDGRDHADRM